MNKIKTIFFALSVIAIGLYLISLFVFKMPTFGGTFEGLRLDAMKKSPQYKETKFENTPPQDPDMHLLETFKLYMKGQKREPQFELPIVKLKSEDFPEAVENGLRSYWFGHASVLVEIDGVRIMTDPVFSEYAAPFQIMGMPRRLHPVPLDIDLMPKIDAVVISHDHYDHLDMSTIQKMSSKGTHFYVGLGIGAHLERWNVPVGQIHEMDWWEHANIKGVSIHCVPTRHYSGRKKMDNSTLWAAWFVKSNDHSFYFSGDTGYASHFTETKNRLGAPELAILKIGAYGETWLDIHMDPESAVKAFGDLGAKTMLPVHWATFNLSYHDWAEPIHRTLAAASGQNVITPMVGERYIFGQPFTNRTWYEAKK